MLTYKTTNSHHESCPYGYAWDVAGECGAVCSCPKGWPRKVCASCWCKVPRHSVSCKYYEPKPKAKTHRGVDWSKVPEVMNPNEYTIREDDD